MGCVIGGVEIDRDAARVPVPAPVMPFEDAGRQLAPHCVERVAPDLIFEARDRRLRGERFARHRVPAEQQLMNGVVGETVGIVAIGMATRDAEDPLAQQILQRVAGPYQAPGRRPNTRRTRRPARTVVPPPSARRHRHRSSPAADRTWRRGACRRDLGKRTVCGIVSSFTQAPPLWGRFR